MARTKKKPDAETTGLDLVDQMTTEPTLDDFFDRNPNDLSDEDLWNLIGNERRNRAMFIKKGE